MLKKLTFIMLAAVMLSACNKGGNTKCPVQTCTTEYVYFGIVFKNKTGEYTQVKDYTVINLRTKKAVTRPTYPPGTDFVAGFYMVASDDNRAELSTNGDDLEISATNTVTGQTKKVTMRISGGCNCHVSKISGPDTVTFD